MSLSPSQIQLSLSFSGNASLHRQVYILSGQVEWQEKLLKEILSGYESSVLWVAENKVNNFPFVNVKKVATWLGKEKNIVVFDANEYFNPDSFAAISGIVVGGGIFFLLLAEKEKWHDVYRSRFGQRFINSLQTSNDLTVIEQSDNNVISTFNNPLPKNTSRCDSPFLTVDQQTAVAEIEQEIINSSNTPVVLVSDRGRGKSAALGIVAARLIKSGIKNIAITAPRLSATDVIFKHVAENLPAAEVSRGCVRYRTPSEDDAFVQFYSPDHLMQENIKADVLLVDEAAAIPVPILTSFLDKYSQCVFSTTVHGYEGTGRGFSLRFYNVLDKKYKSWLKLKMKTPVRWAENDPLEKWMFSLLCLDAEIISERDLSGLELARVTPGLLNKSQLDDNKLLNEIFSLLVLAHYRTRPKDLMQLLDDEAISVYVSLYDGHVIAVALVIREGSFTQSLSSEVYQGKRRPQGHLLAQALTYHCGIEQAATLDYARIMRIAVHPGVQQKGIGTSLINFIIRTEQELGRDAIGTSFGMNLPLLDFWKKSDFDLVRIGFTREQTSGEHAAIMLHALSSAGKKIKQASYAQFNEKLEYWFDDVLNDISAEIKNSFLPHNPADLQLTPMDEKDLNSFIYFSRNYELCISAINKVVVGRKKQITDDAFPDKFRKVLLEKVINKKKWKKTSENIGLSGKKEVRGVFKAAIVYLLGLSAL